MLDLIVPVEVSARHIHLTPEIFNTLFGENKKLSVKKELSQPFEFLSFYKLTVHGPKGKIDNISVLGPFRKQTQVEVSITDALKLGIPININKSGDLDYTAGCTLIGPIGEVKLDSGVIIAKRHIHLNEDTAGNFNIKNNQVVSAKITTKNRSCLLYDVIARVSQKFADTCHLDTDEGNACGILRGDKIFAQIII